MPPPNQRAESRAATPARAHHYVPEFYLAGFTLSGDRQDALWVRDREQERRWQTRPTNIAHQRDFYRIAIDGVEPDAVEKALSQFEGLAARVLSEIREQRTLPDGEDFAILINFVALQAARVPYHREWYEGQATHLAKWRARVTLGYPEMFERFVNDMQQRGEEVPDFVTREGMLEFLEDQSRYAIEIPREDSIRHMSEMIETLVPLLAQRSWSLFVVQDERHDFICSDRPVILVPTKPDPPPFRRDRFPTSRQIFDQLPDRVGRRLPASEARELSNLFGCVVEIVCDHGELSQETEAVPELVECLVRRLGAQRGIFPISVSLRSLHRL